MAYYDAVRHLMEMERRRPRGVEINSPSVRSPDTTLYGDPFTGSRGALGGAPPAGDAMSFFSAGPPSGPSGQIGNAMLQKLMQPIPNKSSMQDNAMGAVQGFMQMGGGGGFGGGGMSTSGLGEGAGSFGGAEGGVGAFQGGGTTSLGTNLDVPSAGGVAAFDPGYDMGQPGAGASPPPSYDLGQFEYDKAGGDNAASYTPGAGLMPTSPTQHSAIQEQLSKLVSGQSPAEYFARKMGATPAQQAAAKMIEQTLMSHRKKGQAGMNAGRIAAMFA